MYVYIRVLYSMYVRTLFVTYFTEGAKMGVK